MQVTSMDTSPSYSDNTVSAGQTYYYVVTAIDDTGAESVYSNQAQATVPSP
jgi:fibronectin type 3 domain-containing protein